MERRRADLQRERGSLDAESALLAQRIALAEQALARLESLRSDNFVSSAQVQAKTEELLGLRSATPGAGCASAARMSAKSPLREAQLRDLPLQCRRAPGRDRARTGRTGAKERRERSAPQPGGARAAGRRRQRRAGLCRADGRCGLGAGQPGARGLGAAGAPVRAVERRRLPARASSRCCCATTPSRTRSSATSTGASSRCRWRRCSRPNWLVSLGGRRRASRCTASRWRSNASRCRRTASLQPLAPGMQLDADVPCGASQALRVAVRAPAGHGRPRVMAIRGLARSVSGRLARCAQRADDPADRGGRVHAGLPGDGVRRRTATAPTCRRCAGAFRCRSRAPRWPTWCAWPDS